MPDRSGGQRNGGEFNWNRHFHGFGWFRGQFELRIPEVCKKLQINPNSEVAEGCRADALRQHRIYIS